MEFTWARATSMMRCHFCLLLSARGMTAMASVLARLAARMAPTISGPSLRRVAASGLVAALALALICCNLFYYLPRQAALYQKLYRLACN